MAAHSAVISLNKLRLQLRLGCTDTERATPQPVDVSVKFFFDTPPVGCMTDALADTVCYDDITTTIRNYCNGKEFHLLERLGKDLYEQVCGKAPKNAKIWVKVVKCMPPVEGLESFDFIYSDLPPELACRIV